MTEREKDSCHEVTAAVGNAALGVPSLLNSDFGIKEGLRSYPIILRCRLSAKRWFCHPLFAISHSLSAISYEAIGYRLSAISYEAIGSYTRIHQKRGFGRVFYADSEK